MNLFKSNPSGRLILIGAFAILLIISCKKITDSVQTLPVIPAPPDLTSMVSSSASGFVTDENDIAVRNAGVQIGTANVQTDKYGFFEARNVQVIQNAAVVTVTKPGYFKGIKTYIAIPGKSSFFRIKLIPKNNAGMVSGTAGGIITLPNNLSISFPANSVVNAATNTLYPGTVNVSASWIDPSSPDLPLILPGDLRGLNTGGNLQLLTTYGMAAVELTGSGGELLQIAPGKKASLSMPIPASMSATAPATIPLWYFDETKGLWKQEGSANKSGNNYVGDVSHFSFWNCDVPQNYVQFNCTIVNQAGQPFPNVKVKISVVNNPSNNGTGFTNAAGFVSGAVPDNQQLLLQVLTPCNSVIYSQTFVTTNINISLGSIAIPPGSTNATITGTVTNCSNNPVTAGNIYVSTSTYQYANIPITNTGTYSFNVLVCSGSANFTLIAQDSSGENSLTLNFTVTPGTNNIPNIQACGGPALSNAIGYFYHPTAPRPINYMDSIIPLSPNSIKKRLGDLSNQIIVTRDAANNLTVTDVGVPVGITPTTILSVLPIPYTPFPGSNPAVYDNKYDPILRKYRLRYGYTSASGQRVIEEIVTVL